MDHREIGRKLGLFMFHELSPGSPIWLPNGSVVYNILSQRIRELNLEAGYGEVRTPVLWNHELYKLSGHWDHYRDNMYGVHSGKEDDKLYSLKPMNCPGHMLVYKAQQFSYADLPYRLHDQTPLHRDEVSGALGGLTRCRSFCQDDGHVFLAPDQIQAEVSQMIGMVGKIYTGFDMEMRLHLSTRPKESMGTAEQWEAAESALRLACECAGNIPAIDRGGGAFYGPKLDFFVKDSQGREWQTATIQLDFQLPQRFELEYTDRDGLRKTPVVIHRAYYGSFERFIGILLEHYQGLPEWLTPVQAIFLPISDRHVSYCEFLRDEFSEAGIRCEIDANNRTLNRKIVDARERLIPFALIAGDDEQAKMRLSYRHKDKKDSDLWKGVLEMVKLQARRHF